MCTLPRSGPGQGERPMPELHTGTAHLFDLRRTELQSKRPGVMMMFYHLRPQQSIRHGFFLLGKSSGSLRKARLFNHPSFLARSRSLSSGQGASPGKSSPGAPGREQVVPLFRPSDPSDHEQVVSGPSGTRDGSPLRLRRGPTPAKMGEQTDFEG